jgi:hypothetical protein
MELQLILSYQIHKYLQSQFAPSEKMKPSRREFDKKQCSMAVEYGEVYRANWSE